MSFAPDDAQYLLEGYGSGSPDTGVDEWDVALVTKDGAGYIVARGYTDGVGAHDALDPTARTAVIDVVSPVQGGDVRLEVPDSDDAKTVGAQAYDAIMKDFDAMRGALDFQARVAAAEANPKSDVAGTSARLRTLSNSSASSCGTQSRTAAGALDRVRGSSQRAPGASASTPANNGTLAAATHACPVQTKDFSFSGNTDAEGDIRGTLDSVRGIKRFFERNRTVLASTKNSGKAELLGLLRCVFGKVVTGVYLFSDVTVPTSGVADFIASKGAQLPGTLLPKALALAPGLADAADLEVGVWGGLDISDGVTSPDAVGGFDIAVDHGMHIPFVGSAYIGAGAGAGYSFTTKEWEEPEWEAEAGDIPLSFGVEAGLGVFVTKGDAMGIFIEFDLGDGGADWGIEIDFSRSGMGAFLDAAMSRTFVDGCKTDGR